MVGEKCGPFVEEDDDAVHNEAFNNYLKGTRRQVAEDAPRATRETYEDIKGQNKYCCKNINSRKPY